MRNEFKFKGVSSDDFGIIVQELPPIRKPPKRTRYNYIEGLDGATIEELGYDGYDKSFFIGLKTIDRIDEINAWHTGTGDLIISNEPDKVYKATALSDISFNRHGRFRIADIAFYVQPYKYLLNEQPTTSLTINNEGTVNSLPLIEITGTGTVQLLVNSRQFCTLDIDGKIILDSEKQNAYFENGELANRSMAGYFPYFEPGENTISLVGSYSQCRTTVRSRFI